MVGCGICLAEYQEEEVELHQKMCVVRLVFRCTLCDEDYMNKEGLWNHMDLHEIADESKESHYQEIKANQKLHQCALCNDQRAYLESHYREHIQNVHDGFILRCSECGENFQSEKLMNDHTQSHCKLKDQTVTSESGDHEADQKLSSIKCPINVEKLTSDAVQLKHSRGESNEEIDSPLPCDDSGDYSLSNMNADIDTANSIIETKIEVLPVVTADRSVRSFACDICGITFPTYSKAYYHKRKKHKHVKRDHRARRSLRNKKNGPTVNNTENIDLKMEITVEETTLMPLDGCGRSMAPSSSTETGRNGAVILTDRGDPDVATEKPSGDDVSCNKCSHCGKMLSSAVTLSRHILNSHVTVACDICGTTLPSRCAIRSHKHTFHAEPKHVCTTCGKKYHFKSQYRAHLPACESRKYSCETCDQRFKHASTVTQHKKRFHQKEYNLTNVQIDQEQLRAENNDLKMEITVEETTLMAYDDQGQSTVNPSIDVTTSHKNANDHAVVCSSEQTSSEKQAGSEKISQSLAENLLSQPYWCHICGISSPSYSKATHHKRTMHTGLKHQCPHCLKKFYDKGALKIHAPVCATRKETCELCGRKFKNKNCLTGHLKRVHHVNGTSKNVNFEGMESSEEQKLKNVEKVDSEKSTARCSGENSTVRLEENSDSFKVTEKNVLPHVENVPCTKCPYCGKDFSNGGGFLPHHIEQNHIPCQCKICGITFASARKATYHKFSRHKERKHKCPHCPLRFSQSSRYRTHLSVCERKKFSCDLCGNKFKSYETAVRHENIFHRDKKALIKTRVVITECPICGENFDEQHLLFRHVGASHQMTICVICGKTFAGADELMNHKHPENDTSKDVEAEDATLENTIKVKEEYIEQEEDVLTVDQSKTESADCSGDSSDRNETLVRHKVDGQFGPCSICGLTFATKPKMEYHMITFHTEPRYKCSQCPKTFHFVNRQRRHEMSHSRSRSKKYILPSSELLSNHEVGDPCSICGLIIRKYKMKYHMIVSHTEPQYKCSQCTKMFHSAFALRRHEMIHGTMLDKESVNTSSELLCNKCGLQFFSNRQLNHHKMTKHTELRSKQPLRNQRVFQNHMDVDSQVVKNQPHSQRKKTSSDCSELRRSKRISIQNDA
ncbi:zinc finger protein 729-like [Ochlerotatus camptorhynchus]|uniref:zinc finger protein 729-like n=1 Tax=Ochlerotatus camptorhynchus TaxID=644619 RepID=UPI0031CECC2A